MRKKLKQIIVDNLLAMVVSFAAFVGSAYALSNNFMPNLRGAWFIVFFVGFIVFMYNVVVILNVEHLGKRFITDIKDLSDGKIDGMQHDKPLNQEEKQGED